MDKLDGKDYLLNNAPLSRLICFQQNRIADANRIFLIFFLLALSAILLPSCHAVAVGVGGRHQAKRCFFKFRSSTSSCLSDLGVLCESPFPAVCTIWRSIGFNFSAKTTLLVITDPDAPVSQIASNLTILGSGFPELGKNGPVTPIFEFRTLVKPS